MDLKNNSKNKEHSQKIDIVWVNPPKGVKRSIYLSMFWFIKS